MGLRVTKEKNKVVTKVHMLTLCLLATYISKDILQGDELMDRQIFGVA